MRLWILLLILFTSTVHAQYKDGIVVVQYSADFVKVAEVDLDNLEGADQYRFYLTDHPKLFQKDKNISVSISCTTRPKRKGEINKKDYIFISDDNFKRKIKSGKFLEYASVFGYRYGTLSQTVNNFFKKKKRCPI